ncbi:proton-conducting transporter transmembrane domain-containing protein [Schlesneria paludicola]|uniref:proton-conducting transporter transmembrane domain-containing protein n=1 Tax=Schlesneria paludicola TaxID=360056 RepID=UPI000299EC6A|nr:proton-conducting transporter membrane subunit [Schlesneria paludicola]
MASLNMITTRLLRIPEKSLHGPFLLLGLVLASGFLLFERQSQGVLPGNSDTESIWAQDTLSAAEQWVVLLFGALAGLATWDQATDERTEPGSSGYVLFLLAGLMFAACANDFLTMGLSIEIVSLALRGIRLRERDATRHPGAQTERVDDRLRWLSSAFMWYGIALMANSTGTTQLNATRLILVDAYAPGGEQTSIGAPSKMILLAAGLIIVSQLARMGLVPFHFGLGLNRSDQRLKLTGLTILAQQLAGSIVLTRLCSVTFAGFDQSLSTLLTAIILVNFVVASVMSSRAESPGVRSLPRWLGGLVLLQNGWLSIGWMLAAAESGHPQFRAAATHPLPETMSVLVLTQLAGLLSCGGVFWVLCTLARKDRDVEFMEDLKGLGRTAPISALSLTVALASTVAIPWTAGFWVRWLTLLAVHNLHAKHESPVFLPEPAIRFVILMGILATLFVARIAVRLMRETYLEAPHMRPVISGTRGPFLAAAIAATLTIMLGIAPQLVLRPLAGIQPPHRAVSNGKMMGSGLTPVGMRPDRSP